MNARHRRHTVEEEARNREAALDRTIEDSFPASDPPSSIPNPDDDERDPLDHVDERDGQQDRADRRVVGRLTLAPLIALSFVVTGVLILRTSRSR
jgi:hypothetical protein